MDIGPSTLNNLGKSNQTQAIFLVSGKHCKHMYN
jgi:hypothetical protein